MKRIVPIAVLLLVLSACGEESVPEQQPDDERSARGEVLGGTISDDMLPLDTRRSQAPALVDEGENEPAASGDAPPSPEASPAEADQGDAEEQAQEVEGDVTDE